MLYRIIRSSNYTWAEDASKLINTFAINCLSDNKKCDIFLTGGNTAKDLYRKLRTHVNLFNNAKINYFLGDERYLPENHHHSNAYLCHEFLFKENPKQQNNFYHFDCANSTPEEAAIKYNLLMPRIPNIIIISLGEDGHIASLFKDLSHSKIITNNIMISMPNNYKYLRISITKEYIEKAEHIILLAIGSSKKLAYQELINGSNHIYKNNIALFKKTIILTNIDFPS
jgi:6-phosphogluconolactonase